MSDANRSSPPGKAPDPGSKRGSSSLGSRRKAPTEPQGEGEVGSYGAGDVVAKKYQLLRLLGEGGMGSVWVAHNLALDADVAIKFIRHGTDAPDAVARLLQEARAAAPLRHPSIVRIFDLGQTEQGHPFIVMELLDGESLGDVLDRKLVLPAENAVQTLLPVVAALSHAHDAGVVHRDIKPENIMLSPLEGNALLPKVVDFGVVKVSRESPGRPQTGPEVVAGSPDYMSPEQARGKNDVDHRADLWSLCVVLFEMVAGFRPFQGDNARAILASIIEDEPASLVEHGFDEKLALIVGKGLKKNPDERWHDARALGRALASWAIDRDIETDLTGASIGRTWFDEVRRPLSEAPSRASLAGRPSNPGFAAPLSTPVPPTDSAPPSDRLSTPEPFRPHTPLPVIGPDESGAVPLAAPLVDDERPTEPPAADRTTGLPVWSPTHRRRRWPFAIGLILVAGATLWAASTPPREVETQDPTSAAATTTSMAGSAVSSMPAQPSAVPATPEPAPSEPAVEAQLPLDRCAAMFFPPSTFQSSAAADDFAFICSERDPRKGAKQLHKRVVEGAGSGEVTDAMRHWSQLGWYEMALYAAIRGRCCDEPKRIYLPAPVGSCPSMGRALDTIAETYADGAEMDDATNAFREAIHCTLKSGGDSHYSYHEAPQGSAEPLFVNALAQAREGGP